MEASLVVYQLIIWPVFGMQEGGQEGACVGWEHEVFHLMRGKLWKETEPFS